MISTGAALSLPGNLAIALHKLALYKLQRNVIDMGILVCCLHESARNLLFLIAMLALHNIA